MAVMYLEINHATAARRLHSPETLRLRLAAMKVVGSLPTVQKDLYTTMSLFRVAQGKDLLARRARETGAWGAMDTRTCRACDSTGSVYDVGNGKCCCCSCDGRGYKRVLEHVIP